MIVLRRSGLFQFVFNPKEMTQISSKIATVNLQSKDQNDSKSLENEFLFISNIFIRTKKLHIFRSQTGSHQMFSTITVKKIFEKIVPVPRRFEVLCVFEP